MKREEKLMLAVETLLYAVLIAASIIIAFLWGMRIGKDIENKEVKKVAGFLRTVCHNDTFNSPEAIEAASTVANWLAEDNRRVGYFSGELFSTEEKKGDCDEELVECERVDDFFGAELSRSSLNRS